MDSSDVKPKRVLTEAQRLAFLKGREKRMANIEKNRLAKLEFQEATKEETPAVVPEKKKEDPQPLTPVVKVEEKVEEIPPMPKLRRQKVVSVATPTPSIDEDKIASIVADKIMAQMIPPEKEKKPRKPRVAKIPVAESKNDENPDPNQPRGSSNVPPFVHNFSWL